MQTVRAILAEKGSAVLSIGKDVSVRDAAIVMNEHRVGALVVLEAGRLAGIFTERDVLMRVVSTARDPAQTKVADVMTTDLLCCSPEMTLEEARETMKDRRIRHLPVVDEDRRLLGLISIGDLNAHQVSLQERTIFHLHEYLYGRV